jgi:hypothetical protein
MAPKNRPYREHPRPDREAIKVGHFTPPHRLTKPSFSCAGKTSLETQDCENSGPYYGNRKPREKDDT